MVYPGKFPAGGMAAKAPEIYNFDAPEIKFHEGGTMGGGLEQKVRRGTPLLFLKWGAIIFTMKGGPLHITKKSVTIFLFWSCEKTVPPFITGPVLNWGGQQTIILKFLLQSTHVVQPIPLKAISCWNIPLKVYGESPSFGALHPPGI